MDSYQFRNIDIVVAGESLRPVSTTLDATGEETSSSYHDNANYDAVGPNPQGSSAVDAACRGRGVSLRKRFSVGTWNVRSLYQCGKLANVCAEMDRLCMSVIGLSEVRWTCKGSFDYEDKKVIYSGKEPKTGYNPGVGFVLNSSARKSLLGYNPINDRLVSIRLRAQSAHPYNVTILQFYAPTSVADETAKS